MAYGVRTLKRTHKTDSFHSGSDVLDDWLRTTARQHQKKGISKTYVLIDDGAPDSILGFFTLAIRKMMPREALPVDIAKRLPRSVPCYTLARLAVAKELHGQGFGESLLVRALQKARAAAIKVGGVAVFVDAKDVATAEFYKAHGFAPTRADPLVLSIAINNIPD